VDIDTVTCSDDEHISGVQEEQDRSKHTALRHTVLDCRVRRVLASDTDPLCTTSDKTCDP